MRAIPPFVILVLCAGLGACSVVQARAPTMPSQQRLTASEAILAKAEKAGAADFAPAALGQARRRLTLARAILFKAAAAKRKLTAREDRHVGWLADEAGLDARLALARTQVGAVNAKTKELQAELDKKPATDKSGTPAGAGGADNNATDDSGKAKP